MDYKLNTAVWEITMGCNMRCGHCGSTCTNPLPGELSTDEALGLCSDLKKLGLEHITLSGGEPFTRNDWHLIAKRLTSLGVKVNIISNGWLIDKNIVDKVVGSSITTVGISLDGMKESHDLIRKEGSFLRVLDGLKLLQNKGVSTAICTTFSNTNFKEIEEIYNLVLENNVDMWQVQLAIPMGSMNKENILNASKLNDILRFIKEKQSDKTNGVHITITDHYGYNTLLSESVRGCYDNCYWGGCQAGKSVLGVLHNGDIIGCTSFRNREYIEGNIRDRNIIDIWNSKNAFDWNRNLKSKDLTGFCLKCQYSDTCMGGCTSLKYFTTGCLTENLYCSHYQNFRLFKNAVSKIGENDKIEQILEKCLNKESYNMAEECLDILLRRSYKNIKYKQTLGFVYYQLNRYADCLEVNKEILDENPTDAYALKGMGLSLVKMGDMDNGIDYLKKSVLHASGELVVDCQNDLDAVLATI